jgi:flagellar hook-associated protein 3 FlgL
MSVRVNPDLYSTITNGLAQNTQRQDQVLQELASGQKLNSPSDDPAAVASLVSIRTESSSVTQYLSNISSLTGSLQVADSALNSVVEELTSAVSLGTEGANGTLNSANQQAIAQEVQGIQQQILSLANTSYNGQYLFSGTATTTQPYVADSSSSSGVTYKGNSNINSVEISEGQAMPINMPGSQLFSNSTTDVFQSLQDLYNALENGGDVSSATTEVQNALSYVTTQSTFYGNSLDRLNNAQTFLNSEQLQLSTSEGDILDVDMSQAATDLAQTETTQTALLSAGGDIAQLSLFNYLPQE